MSCHDNHRTKEHHPPRIRVSIRAFDASNIATELWDSNQNKTRDYAGSWAKWCPPTVANGYVYLPTFDKVLNVYGLLATAGGLVFFGEDSGAFAALDAKTGKLLWYFQTNQLWKASPMTYVVNGKQYVAVAAGSNIVSFALP